MISKILFMLQNKRNDTLGFVVYIYNLASCCSIQVFLFKLITSHQQQPGAGHHLLWIIDLILQYINMAKHTCAYKQYTVPEVKAKK